MEHRWGERISLDLPVRLDVRSNHVSRAHPIIHGRIKNVSLSGAFVSTRNRIPVWAQIRVELHLTRFRRTEPYRAAAHVVRTTADGIGIEWEEFAPRAVRALFAVKRVRKLPRDRAEVPIACQRTEHPPHEHRPREHAPGEHPPHEHPPQGQKAITSVG